MRTQREGVKMEDVKEDVQGGYDMRMWNMMGEEHEEAARALPAVGRAERFA